MKHIKTITELNKSTYVSAAKKLDKLGGKHKNRSKELMKHSDKYGEDYDIHNIHYHEFEIGGDWGYGYKCNSKYTISDASIRKEEPYCFITVKMYDNTGDSKSIQVNFMYLDEHCSKIHYHDVESTSIEYENMYLIFHKNSPAINFKFNTRKDAIEFKNFVLDFFKDNTEFEREIESFKNVSINKLFD